MARNSSALYRRVYCGDCGNVLNCALNRYMKNYVYIDGYCCPKVKSHENMVSPSDIQQAVKALILQERQEAIDTASQIQAFFDSGEYQKMEERYLTYIHAQIDKIRENCEQINALYMRHQDYGPLPQELQPEFDALYTENREAAASAAALEREIYRFRSGFTLENKWLRLYTSLPEEFVLTKEHVKKYAPHIFLFHDKHITVTIVAEDAKRELQWCLALPDSPDSAYAAICNPQRREARSDA